jgi:DNA adenine methylase
MTRSISPLRYPGGKASLYGFMCKFLDANGLYNREYVEPYAGGCGLGLRLLLAGKIERLHINDLDRSIWAFWYAAINHTDAFIERIRSIPLTVDEWRRARQVQSEKADTDAFNLGFSTFFLNRTSVSGVIHSGGVIGGLNQTGEYKIDCRFNREDLANRIRRIANYRRRIDLYNQDAEIFLDNLADHETGKLVVYIDPPYFEKGQSLYHNAYSKSDHANLAKAFEKLNFPWLITYDDTQGIRNIYGDDRCSEIAINYSARIKRVGREVLIVKPGLVLPN